MSVTPVDDEESGDELSLHLEFDAPQSRRLKALRDRVQADDWYEFFGDCITHFETSVEIAQAAAARNGAVYLVTELPDGTSEKVLIYPQAPKLDS